MYAAPGEMKIRRVSGKIQAGGSVQGRVVIVTGGGKGLGRAYCEFLAASGMAVVVNNRRHAGESDGETSAGRVVAAIKARGGAAVASFDAVETDGAGERMVRLALQTFGRLDAVIANAALSQERTFHKLALPEFRHAFDVSFLGTLQLVHAAWPVLKEQGYGRVVMTTSSAGRYGNHGLSAYAAAKGAIEALMRSLAEEGKRYGILVNAISPYATTQMTEAHLDAQLAARMQPEDVAPLAGWLAGEACNVSGEVLVAAGHRLRRAFPVETASIAVGDNVPATIEALRAMAGNAYASANAAFATYATELQSAAIKSTP